MLELRPNRTTACGEFRLTLVIGEDNPYVPHLSRLKLLVNRVPMSVYPAASYLSYKLLLRKARQRCAR
eukprot:5292626-Pyramimonas_sp.AAC.1